MDGPYQYNFNLTKDLFKPEVLKGEFVTQRLDYILPRQKEMMLKNNK
jgi:hypothetical protein